MSSSKFFMGLDLSPNHSAGVVIDLDGRLVQFSCITNHVTVNDACEHARFQAKTRPKGTSKEAHSHARLKLFERWLSELLTHSVTPEATCVENYSFGSRTNAAYQIGEIGGVARVMLVNAKAPFRLVAPPQLKSYANIPSSQKPIARCLERYGVDWQAINMGTKSDTAGDLSDAHMLAHMAREGFLIERDGSELMTRDVMLKVLSRGVLE